LIHRSDRGSQCLSIICAERLAEMGVDLSVGAVGDSFDNALAESVIGPFRTEVLNVLGPWRTLRDDKWRTLKGIDWRNNRRRLDPIGYVPPAEPKIAYCAALNANPQAA